MSKKYIIKPHHFLDIIKLYGSGIDSFVPDKNYGHDFYRIGNIILQNKQTLLVITLGPDDICKPCKYLRDGKCIDVLEDSPVYALKEEQNKVLDTRICHRLGLQEGQIITATQFCRIARERLRDIFGIWRRNEFPEYLTALHARNLFRGLNKFLNQ